MIYDEFEIIADGDNGDYEFASDEEITDQGRWTTTFSRVVRQKSSGKFFALTWERGSTEYQHQDGEDNFWYINEVYPKEVMKTIYVTKDPKSDKKC